MWCVGGGAAWCIIMILLLPVAPCRQCGRLISFSARESMASSYGDVSACDEAEQGGRHGTSIYASTEAGVLSRIVIRLWSSV